MFCTIMSTEIFLAAIFENSARLVPGLSGTPSSVTRASFLTNVAAADCLIGRLGLGHDQRAGTDRLKLLRT